MTSKKVVDLRDVRTDRYALTPHPSYAVFDKMAHGINMHAVLEAISGRAMFQCADGNDNIPFHVNVVNAVVLTRRLIRDLDLESKDVGGEVMVQHSPACEDHAYLGIGLYASGKDDAPLVRMFRIMIEYTDTSDFEIQPEKLELPQVSWNLNMDYNTSELDKMLARAVAYMNDNFIRVECGRSSESTSIIGTACVAKTALTVTIEISDGSSIDFGNGD